VPLHPRTQKILKQNGLVPGFLTLEPVGYFDIVELMKNSALVVTDSGGMQKEAYFYGRYCLTLREETEWTELVENGYNMLVGCDRVLIQAGVEKWLGRKVEGNERLYGSGNAADLITERLQDWLC